MNDGVSKIMTVARVYEPTEEGVEVTFLESAMFYRLPVSVPDFELKFELLREAAEKGFKVEVVRESRTTDVIEDVKKST